VSDNTIVYPTLLNFNKTDYLLHKLTILSRQSFWINLHLLSTVRKPKW